MGDESTFGIYFKIILIHRPHMPWWNCRYGIRLSAGVGIEKWEGKQAPAAKPDPLRTAVAAFIKAKGRFHTERGYKALVEAFNANGRD